MQILGACLNHLNEVVLTSIHYVFVPKIEKKMYKAKKKKVLFQETSRNFYGLVSRKTFIFKNFFLKIFAGR